MRIAVAGIALAVFGGCASSTPPGFEGDNCIGSDSLQWQRIEAPPTEVLALIKFIQPYSTSPNDEFEGRWYSASIELYRYCKRADWCYAEYWDFTFKDKEWSLSEPLASICVTHNKSLNEEASKAGSG